MKIREVLKKKGGEVHTIDAKRSVAEAVASFSSSKRRGLVVTKDAKAVGMLTIRDTLLHLNRKGGEALAHRVTEAMSKKLVSITPESTVEEAHALFKEKAINHLPVVGENGELVGLVTRVDVLAEQMDNIEGAHAKVLDYIAGNYS